LLLKAIELLPFDKNRQGATGLIEKRWSWYPLGKFDPVSAPPPRPYSVPFSSGSDALRLIDTSGSIDKGCFA
jgi:hypothetical protein